VRSSEKLVLAVVAFVALAAPGLAADPPAPSASEEDAIFAAAQAETWREPDAAGFVRALRKAIARRDATATALLVQFPLHLNHEDGIVTALENARALEARFDEAFPPELRATLAKTDDADWWLKAGPDDLGIANGLLWAKLVGHEKTEHYLLATVNLPDPKGASARRLKGLQFTCQTEKHHIAIDAAAGDKVRYRAWNKPHFPPDAPDMEVVGTWDYAGTGVCAHRVWTFTSGDAAYSLEEEQCGESPPEGATASLEVHVGGKLKRVWWCY
jgi:hypothetical protein